LVASHVADRPEGRRADLPGALGKLVFLALPYVPDWRWLTDRGDTAWYPATTIFRQGADRQWQPVFAAIAAKLKVNPAD